MKKGLSILLCLLLSLALWSQNDPEPLGGRSGAMANVSVCLQDAWSLTNNQAGIARLESPEATAFYRNRFFVEGLSYQSVAFVYPTASGVFGISAVSDGNSLYRETRYGLAYGRKLSDIFDMGVQVNYHGTRIQSSLYGSSSAITAELGVMAQVTKELRLGAHLFNPTKSFVIQEPPERIATQLKVGALYSFSEKLLLTAELAKSLEQKSILRVGAEYQALDKVYLRAGVGTEPTLTAFGIGTEVSGLKLDVAASYHNTLGYSTTLSLSYQFSKMPSDG